MFKLTDLKSLYKEHIQRLGGNLTKDIHSTRLAQKLQQHIPSLDVHNSKSGTILSFKKDLGDVLLDACHSDPDNDGSGWVHVMTSSNVTTEGRAFGLQKGSHTSRAQWAHQVTAAALFVLLRRSYDAYHTMTPDDEKLDFEMWCKEMASDHQQFYYWYKVLQLELLFLQFQ